MLYLDIGSADTWIVLVVLIATIGAFVGAYIFAVVDDLRGRREVERVPVPSPVWSAEPGVDLG